MPVVDVRQVRMVMEERRVLVDVRVRFRHWRLVHVSMVLVVHVGVLVLDPLVQVRVPVTGTHDERDSDRHHRARDDMSCRQTITEQRHGDEVDDRRECHRDRSDEREVQAPADLYEGACEQASFVNRVLHVRSVIQSDRDARDGAE